MKLQLIVTTLLLISLLCLTVVAADKADFNGKWTMDKSKSEGIPPDMNQNMKVEQEGDKIAIETDLFQGENVQTVPDQYTLDGKEIEIPGHTQSGEEVKVKRLAKWNAEGNGFEVKDVATVDTPDGKVTITTVRKWMMAADGRSLVIELTRTGPNGTNASKRTFTKK